jgi:hypothetical protein
MGAEGDEKTGSEDGEMEWIDEPRATDADDAPDH